MSVAVLREAEDRVDELQLARPAAYTLARVLAPAARIERTLLRRARLELTDADASAEADLWLCGLVSSQTPQGIVLEREAAAILRARLAADRVTFERACALIAWEHRDAPWPVRVEERIYQLTAAQDAQVEDAEAVLVAAARRMLESTDRRAVGAWVLRTLMRLPPGLDRSPDVESAMNAQIAAELYSSHLYLAMSAYCESINMSGSAAWFAAQSDEEREHALKFARHVVERGGRVTLVGMDPEHGGSPRVAAVVDRNLIERRKERVCLADGRFVVCECFGAGSHVARSFPDSCHSDRAADSRT